jgi:hypothetical protein
VNRISLFLSGICLAIAPAGTAHANEIFGGLFVHDVKTPLNLSGVEGGADVQNGFRGGRIAGTPIQPYGFVSLNTAGETHFAAAGISAKFGRRIYIRPGIGLAVHSGSAGNFELANDEVEFGSRILFQPELGIGMHVNDRLSVEASLVHLSHGTIFSRQNPGIDNLGVRLNFAF